MTQQQTPDAALITIRIIWGAMIMGVLMFGVVVLAGVGSHASTPADPKFIQLLFYIAVGMLCTTVPMGFALRSVIWRQGKDADGRVKPSAYNTGLIIQLAMCEGTAFFALVGTMLNGGRGPHLIVAGIAIAVMVLSFPTGRPLRGDDGIQPIHRRDSEV